METTWIDDPESLAAFCRDVEGEALAVDTESDHFHAYQAQVCLIQLATPDEAALVDPLALTDEQLAPLFELLEQPGLTKILHAARNDIIEVDRDWGVDIVGLFDTRTAARFLGYDRNSLDWLLEEVVGVDSAGSFSRFDWTTRPLPDKARRYAVRDVAHLEELRSRFLEELRRTQWYHPFVQQCAYVARSVSHEPNPFDPEAWRDIKQGRDLDGRGRATLRELYAWRHEVCLDRNEAALHVFKNKVLARVAREQPETREELASLKGVSDEMVEREGQAILEAIERAKTRDMPPARKKTSRSEPPSADQQARYDALRRWRNDTTSQLDIPPEFVATNATIKEIAADPPQSVEELAEFGPILEWHCELFGEEMLSVLEAA